VDKKRKRKVAAVVKKEDAPLDVPGPAMKSRLKPPRQAQSAWQMFFADELVRAKAEHADLPGKLNVAQIAKDAGTAYSNLDPERKAFYAAKVQAAKEQHAREYIAWQAALTPEDIRLENAFRAQQRRDGKSRKANIKDPNAPRKPLSAYFLFLKSIREDAELRAKVWGAEAETTKQSVLAAQRWRALTDVEKQVSTCGDFANVSPTSNEPRRTNYITIQRKGSTRMMPRPDHAARLYPVARSMSNHPMSKYPSRSNWHSVQSLPI
jgi:hypothetical protein